MDSPVLHDPGPLDPRVALSRAGGDGELLRQLAEIALPQLPQWVTEIGHALERDEWPTAKRVAHTLKNSADNFGAAAAVVAAHRLEQLAGKRNHLASHAALADVERAVKCLLPAVARLANTPSESGCV